MFHRLLDLPNEILLNVIALVPNADLDNFTSTCKIIRNAAAKALHQHGQRKRRYRSITYGDPDVTGDDTTWVHPTLMLRDLLRHDLMCYPVELHIENRAAEHLAWDEVDGLLESFSKDLEPLVRICPYLHDDAVDLTQDILKEGDIGATLGFLLTLLQNLKIFHIADQPTAVSAGWDCYTLRSIKIIVDNLLTGSRASSLSSAYVQPLGQLREIILTCSDRNRYGCYSDLATHAPFFYLPSMRTVRLFRTQTTWDTGNLPTFHSEIETLSISKSTIERESLENYLRLTKHLRSFQYTFNSSFAISSRQGIRFLVEDLLKYASASLRYLHIADHIWMSDYDDYGGYPFGSLKNFQVLRSIRISVDRSIPAVDHLRTEWPSVSLTQMLPSSAERVVFGNCLHRVHALAALQELSKKDKTQLMDLKFVSFEFDFFRSEDGESLEWAQGTLRAFDGFGRAITTDVNQWY